MVRLRSPRQKEGTQAGAAASSRTSDADPRRHHVDGKTDHDLEEDEVEIIKRKGSEREKAAQVEDKEKSLIIEDMFNTAPVIRLAKAHTEKGEPQNYKLYTRFAAVDFRTGMRKVFSHAGMERKLGMAPRTAMERILQGKLDKKK